MRNTIKILVCLIPILAFISCRQKDSKLLYSSDTFGIYSDRVIQEDYKSVAISDDKLVSDYQSPANAFLNPQISYKFSINGHDNEAPSYQDHQALLRAADGEKIVI